MLISAASSPNSHCREDGDLGDRLAVCSVETRGNVEVVPQHQQHSGERTAPETQWVSARARSFTAETTIL